MSTNLARPVQTILVEYDGRIDAAVAELAKPIVHFASASVRMAEGNSGTQLLRITARRSGITGILNVTGIFNAGGTTAADFVDGLPGDKVWTFADGSDTAMVDIPIAGDIVLEGDETFSYQLASASAYRLGSPSLCSGVIVNDDAAPVLGALYLSGDIKAGIASNGTIAGLIAGSALTSTLVGLTVNRGAATYAFDGSASAGSSGELIETLAGATNSPRSTTLTVQAGTVTVTPRAADFADSFVGDGGLHTRPGWTVPAGDEGAWGTTAGTLYYKQLYGPLKQAVFGGDLGDQEIVIEYDTTGDSESGGYTPDNTFFDLMLSDTSNFIRSRVGKSGGFITFNPVVDGNERPGATFVNTGVGGDKGKIKVSLANDTLRVAFNEQWSSTVVGRFNFPFDRVTLTQLGVVPARRHGQFGISARTWRYARADGVSIFSSAITIDSDDEFVGRDSVAATGGTWTGTGRYTGTPVRWAARVLDHKTGSIVSDWAVPKRVVAADGAFSIDVFLPLGGPHAVEIAWIGADGYARITRSRPVLSGYHVLYYGQSNSVGRADVDDDAVTGDRYACFVNRNAAQDNAFPAGHWSSSLTGYRPSACMGLARTAAPLLNVPVAITATGVGATGIHYLSPGGAGWTIFLDQTSTLKGVIEAVVLDHGEADADGAQATADYVETFRDVLLPALRQRAGNPDLKVLIAPPGNYPDPPLGTQTQAALNAQRNTIRFAHQTLVDTVSGVSFAGFKLGASHASDPYHYPRTVYDVVLGTRDGLSVAKALGAATYDGRGPQVTGATRAGATLTLAIDLNGAATITGPVDFQTYDKPRVAAPANSFKGYEVSSDDFATRLPISSITVDAGKLVITLASAPAGPVKVRSFAGANHDDSSLFVGTYGGGLTIPVAPIIKHLVA
jgi:hypothetical protein